MSKLNGNSKKIHLSWNADTTRVAFLDLEIFKQGDTFLTKNYFKPTDRNGFIPLDSCHHHSWLYNVPKGQFIRLRRNCALDSDYFSQAKILANRFLQKGYEEEHVMSNIISVGSLDRSSLVANSDSNKKPKGNFEYKIILDYNIQHKKFERIILKHWNILKKDSVLGTVLPSRPKFVYRKPPTLRDILAPSVVDPPLTKKENRIFNFLTGLYACGRCPACNSCRRNLKRRKEFTAAATSQNYQIKHFKTCNTVGVVYMLECDCGLQYIGRTSRPMGVRIAEHVNNIKRGLITHNVSKHFRICHDRNPRCLKFEGIEKVNPHWRGGNFIRQLSQRESMWIHETQVMVPKGLNVEFDLNCFISNK